MEHILIKNGILVNAGETLQGDLLVSHGKIARIGRDIRHGDAHRIVAAGHYVIPGGVDVHTHLNLETGGVFWTRISRMPRILSVFLRIFHLFRVVRVRK